MRQYPMAEAIPKSDIGVTLNVRLAGYCVPSTSVIAASSVFAFTTCVRLEFAPVKQ